MLKKFSILILVISAIIGIVAYSMFSQLDSLVAKLIEKYGTAATGTAVKVSGVHISTSSGQGSISGIIVKNPSDYSTPNAFEMDAISMTIDTSSIFGTGPVIIREIKIDRPQVTFEVANNGTNNLQALSNNAKNYSAANKPADTHEKDKPKSPERKIIINDLYITGGQVGVSNATLLKGKTLSVPLSQIHLTDIGKNGNGTTAAQATKQVLSAITTGAIRDANTAITSQLKNIDLKGSAGAVSNSVKGLLR